jgi:hypothetical protein
VTYSTNAPRRPAEISALKRIADNELKSWRPHRAVSVSLMFVMLILSIDSTYAQSTQDPGAACANAMGVGACSGPRGPVPEVVNDDWNAIAYSPSRNIAAFAGSFTAPDNAKAAALKGCAARASDCRIVAVAHDVCLAVAWELSAAGRFQVASGVTKQEAEGKALPVCLAEGPKRCQVLARCSGHPPILSVSR